MKRIRFALLLAFIAGLDAPPARSQGDARALWIDVIRNPLQEPSGLEYFENTLKDAILPGGVNGIREFRGTVLSAKPADAPSEFVVAVFNPTTPEVTLVLKQAGKVAQLARPVPPGAVVYFSGVPKAFTQKPFMLTMDVDIDNLGIARFTELVE